MSGGSGGSGSGGRSGGSSGAGTDGDAGQPGEVVRQANKANETPEERYNREMAEIYGTRKKSDSEAFIDKLMAEEKAKAAKKNQPTRYERMQGGSSTRDDTNSGGRRSSDKDFLDRMKRYRSP